MTEVPVPAPTPATSDHAPLINGAAYWAKDGVLTFPAGAVYPMVGGVDLHSIHEVRGNGALLVWTAPFPDRRAHVQVWAEGQATKVTGLGVRGSKLDPSQSYVPDHREAQAGFGLDGGSLVVLANCGVCGVWGDIVRLTGNQAAAVYANYGNEAGRHGVALINGNNTWIIGNYLHGCHRWGVDIEPNRSDETVSGVFIAHNDLSYSRGAITGMDDPRVTGVVIGENTLAW